MNLDIRTLVLTGLAVQTLGTLGIAVAAVLLASALRGARVTAARWWSAAWVVLTIALAATALRNVVAFRIVRLDTPWPQLLLGTYFAGKLGYFALLLIGLRVARGRPAPAPGTIVAGGVGLFAATVLVASTGPQRDGVMIAQSLVAVAAFGRFAWEVGKLGPAHGMLAPRFLRTVMLGHVVLWLFYGVGNLLVRVRPGAATERLGTFIGLNSFYVDLLGEVLIGVGMVLLLLAVLARDAVRSNAQRAERERLEAIGRLVSGVAHELNNPLAAILAFSEQLPLPRDAREGEAIATIRSQAVRARTIVRDLLGYVRERPVTVRPVELAELARGVLRAMGPEAERRAVTLLLAAEGQFWVRGDAAAIEQILTNVVQNALHASPAGGSVRVSLAAEDGRVRCLVDDDGPGIADADQQRIFEPFFTTKGAGEGTGLGLSVSLGLAQQMGGTLEATNRRPAGARLALTLPASDAAPTLAAVPAVDGAAAPGSRGVAIVVDDDEPVRRSIHRALERFGWRVEAYGDCETALARLLGAGEAPSLVVSDLRMPGIGGIAMLERCLASDAAFAERLVICTGDSTSPDVTAFLARCPAPVLRKPFHLDELRTLALHVAAARDVAA